MAKKRATYAEKHKFIRAENGVLGNPNEVSYAPLLKIFDNKNNFENTFLTLSYKEQILVVKYLINIANGKNIVQQKGVHEYFQEHALTLLEHIHWMTNSFYENDNSFFPISKDERRLLRMECYGSISRRTEKDLSHAYKFFKSEYNIGNFPLSSYNLTASPMWKVFQQFTSFRSITPQIRRFLYNSQINPEALKIMSINDFCDVIHATFAERPEMPIAYFMQTGLKNQFVIDIMRFYGKDFAKHLIKNRHIDRRAAYSLVRMMSLYGLCNPKLVVITETHYTKRIIEDLKSAGYPTEKLRIGAKIPEIVIQKLFDNHDEQLIVARDKKGNPLSNECLPSYQVHHKGAIKFADNKLGLAGTNYKSNMMLAEEQMHQIYFHGFDDIRDIGKNECFYSRLNVILPDIVIMDGFDSTNNAFCYDFAHTPEQIRRETEDKKYMTNYWKCKIEYLQNVIEISKKYGIKCSPKEIRKEINTIKIYCSKNIDIPQGIVRQIARKKNIKKILNHVMKDNGNGYN